MYFDLWFELFEVLLQSSNNTLSVDSIKLIAGFFAVAFVVASFLVIIKLFLSVLGLGRKV